MVFPNRLSNQSTTMRLSFFAFVFLLAGTFVHAASTPDEVIARARSFIGPEEVLNNLQSIRYVGTVEDAGHVTNIEIVFNKPYFQRVTVRYPEVDKKPRYRQKSPPSRTTRAGAAAKSLTSLEDGN